MGKKLYIFRHGEVDEAYQGKFIGSTNAPLSDQGRSQIKKFQSFLKSFPHAKYYFSPLQRAEESFRLATNGAQVDAVPDNNLREIHFGLWECLRYSEIQNRFPVVYKQWLTWSPDFQYPEGESHKQFLKRITIFKKTVLADPAETIHIFTHGAVIMFLICELLELAPKNYRLFSVKRGSRSLVDISNKPGVLMELNCLNP